MFKRKFNKIHRFIQIHQKTGHIWIGYCDRMSGFYLINKKRNYASPAAHYISITSTADHRISSFCRHTGIGKNHMFHHCLGYSHGIYRIGCFICRKTDYTLNSAFYRCMKHVIRSLNICPYRLHREEFTGRNLFQCRCMKYVVNTWHGIF